MVSQGAESLADGGCCHLLGCFTADDDKQLQLGHLMGVSHWCLQEQLLQNQPTQPSFAAR